MKTLFYLSVILTFFLFTDCNKNKLVPEDEVPQWLKEKIAEDEAVIDSASNPMQFCGAWIRYKFDKDYYFEYNNPLSSVMLEVYNYEGNGFDFYDDELIKSYQDDKCCKRYVWKAPGYDELH